MDNILGSTFSSILNPFCTQNESKIGPNLRSKWCPNGVQEGAEEYQAKIIKTYKNLMFFKVFGILGVPRRVQNPTLSKIEVKKHMI